MDTGSFIVGLCVHVLCSVGTNCIKYIIYIYYHTFPIHKYIYCTNGTSILANKLNAKDLPKFFHEYYANFY